MAPMSSKTLPITMPTRRKGRRISQTNGKRTSATRAAGPADDEEDQEEEKLHGGGCLSMEDTQRAGVAVPWLGRPWIRGACASWIKASWISILR